MTSGITLYHRTEDGSLHTRCRVISTLSSWNNHIPNQHLWIFQSWDLSE